MMALEAGAPSAAHWTAEMYARIFSSEGPSRLALVVEEEHLIKGFLVALCAGPEWELENIVVSQERRRRSRGRQLVAELAQRAQAAAAQAIFLEVRESNQAARELYRKAGFAEHGRRPRYYSDPSEDGILLSRPLASSRTRQEVPDSR
jgi:ribosomal-protein-alanine N-acetyltransferase